MSAEISLRRPNKVAESLAPPRQPVLTGERGRSRRSEGGRIGVMEHHGDSFSHTRGTRPSAKSQIPVPTRVGHRRGNRGHVQRPGAEIRSRGEGLGAFLRLDGKRDRDQEHRPIVPGTPLDPRALTEEICDLEKRLQVGQTLEMWWFSMRELSGPAERKTGAYFYLLYRDAQGRSLEIMPFSPHGLLKAQDAYARAEKRLESEPGAQAVLVSVEELSQLRRAYPNYFFDTRAFLNEVRRVVP